VSWFLCAAALRSGRARPAPNLASCFPAERFTLMDATGTSFGRAAAGNRTDASACLVTVGGCSTDILGRGSRKRTRSAEFLAALRIVVQRMGGVAIVAHFCHGDVREESVAVTDTVAMSYEEFEAQFADIREDVRYVIQGTNTLTNSPSRYQRP
jgi:hypothetical protein